MNLVLPIYIRPIYRLLRDQCCCPKCGIRRVDGRREFGVGDRILVPDRGSEDQD